MSQKFTAPRWLGKCTAHVRLRVFVQHGKEVSAHTTDETTVQSSVHSVHYTAPLGTAPRKPFVLFPLRTTHSHLLFWLYIFRYNDTLCGTWLLSERGVVCLQDSRIKGCAIQVLQIFNHKWSSIWSKMCGAWASETNYWTMAVWACNRLKNKNNYLPLLEVQVPDSVSMSDMWKEESILFKSREMQLWGVQALYAWPSEFPRYLPLWMCVMRGYYPSNSKLQLFHSRQGLERARWSDFW